jgi:hypothetical protein
MGKKNAAGEVVKRDNKEVKMTDRMRRFQRGSRHLPADARTFWSRLKSKESGKLELKPTLMMPLRDAEP